jgi:hypothetical protein
VSRLHYHTAPPPPTRAHVPPPASMTQTEEATATEEKQETPSGFWGPMFKDDGKTGTELLNRLLTGIAQCIV